MRQQLSEHRSWCSYTNPQGPMGLLKLLTSSASQLEHLSGIAVETKLDTLLFLVLFLSSHIRQVNDYTDLKMLFKVSTWYSYIFVSSSVI
jgi:hypothetical protein